MAQRRQPLHNRAADILAEADRTTRKASTSSERARRQMTANQETAAEVYADVASYAEAEAAINAAAQEGLEIQRQIEEEEKRLAEAEAAAAAEAEQIRLALEVKRRNLLNAHRRKEHYNSLLHTANWNH